MKSTHGLYLYHGDELYVENVEEKKLEKREIVEHICFLVTRGLTDDICRCTNIAQNFVRNVEFGYP